MFDQQSNFKKMFSQVESFLCSDKQETPEEGQKIQCPKHCFNLPQLIPNLNTDSWH